MQILLGILIAIFTGIISNLLTPYLKPLWRKFTAMQERGHRAQLEKEIREFQAELDRRSRLQASDKDLYLHLFRWLLGILSFFAAAGLCGVLGFANKEPELIKGALVLLIIASGATLGILGYCGTLTTEGMEKRTAQLQKEIAQRKAQLASQ